MAELKVKTPEEGRITEAAVAELKSRIGVPIPRDDPSFEFAAVDNMRNYARGIGDMNPFFRDPEHARASRWNAFIAHPTFMLYMGMPSGDSETLTGRDPIAGVHSFYSGEEMEWYLPITEGDRLTVRGGLGSAELKPSRMGGQTVHQVAEDAYRNQNGDFVGLRRHLRIRVERSQSRSRGKQMELDVPYHYSEEELKQIDAEYAAEQIRGAEPRYWEDVQVGDVIPTLIKGPWTVTSYICYSEATGPRNNFHRAHSVAYDYRKNHPRAFPLTEYGFPDTVARVHWDHEMANRAGLPQCYDFGGERVAWMSHAITNWMGDDAFLHKLKVRVQQFCFVGDVVRISGTVENKYEQGSNKIVELKLAAVNQRQAEIALADATVILPTKEDNRSTVPESVPEGVSVFA